MRACGRNVYGIDKLASKVQTIEMLTNPQVLDTLNKCKVVALNIRNGTQTKDNSCQIKECLKAYWFGAYKMRVQTLDTPKWSSRGNLS